jgi:CRISPR-associated protein (TIGR03986 family)
VLYLTGTENGKQIVTAFGPTPFFRLPAKHTPATLLQNQTKEVDSDFVDFVRAVFGDLDRNTGNAVRSRVMFSDAHLEVPDDANNGSRGWSPFLTKKLNGTQVTIWTTSSQLLGPKWQSSQMYLDQAEKSRKNIVCYDDDDADLRGWKLYWHRDPELEPCNEHGPDDLGKIAMRPVKAGVSFVGRVVFDCLRPSELGGLLAVLDLPEDSEDPEDPEDPKDFAVKIGYGRPAGLGSVRLDVCSVHLLNLDTPLPSTTEVERNCWQDWKNMFFKCVVNHRSPSSAGGGANGAEEADDLTERFWADARMKELKTMLNFSKKPSNENTAYMPIGQDGDQRRFQTKEPLQPASYYALIDQASAHQARPQQQRRQGGSRQRGNKGRRHQK